MLQAAIWGLVQGLTEFLPVSSSGHLVLIPALLAEMGVDIEPPSLAVSAVLHLGTLLAVLVYFRADLAKTLRMRRDAEGRRIALLVAVGTVPALIGLPLKDSLEELQESVQAVGIALIVTGLILVVGQRLATGTRTLLDGRLPDAVVVGLAQALALIPGISRSGTTISAGNGRRFQPVEAARFAFLLGIPAIAGAGLISLPDVLDAGGLGLDLLVGFVVAAMAGYAAIAFLLRLLTRTGLIPFAVYCLALGTLAVVLF